MTELEYKEMIYKKAEDVKSKEDLSSFLDEIANYSHDYGTIVYGCMAAMKASFKVINGGPNGGITGFQAGCLGWECVHEFMMIDSPAKLVDFNNMLYPQYQDKFEKTISQETWDNLQEKVKVKLSEADEHTHPNILAHWKTVAAGNIPFGYAISQD